ncbi:MAG: SulP family inorganic anion transporter [Povalibacter sp.]
MAFAREAAARAPYSARREPGFWGESLTLRWSPPFLEWLPRLSRQWVQADVVAGLTTAAVVIPKAMGYATIAGLPVEVGLYTAFIPMIVYALLGTSRPLSVSTTTTIAILTAAQLGEVAPNADTATLLQATALITLLVGAILIVASALRLGFVANFISEPVLVGFKAGIALIIVIDQLPKILGIHFTKGSFIHNLQEIARGLSHMSVPTFVLGVVTIAGIAAIEKFKPRWPAPLIAVAVAIAGVAWFGWDRHGIELVGTIQSGLPAPSIPSLDLLEQLWPGALAIALMSFTETAAAGRAFARSDEPQPRPNAELFATGMSNVFGAFLGSMPAGGGTSQTAINRLTGARTPVASLVTASMSLMTMLLLAPLIGLMPHVVLASIVIFYSVGLIKPADFRAILQIRRTEFVWAIAALLGVVLLGTLKGILVAIIVSIVALAQQTADPPVYALRRKPGTNVFRRSSSEHPEDESFSGLLLLRIGGRVFFLNAERIAEKIRPLVSEMKPRVVALDLSGVFDLEYSALKMLIEAERRQREAGVQLWLVGLSPEVLAVIRRSPLAASLGRDRLLFNLEVAVKNYQHLQAQPPGNTALQPQREVPHG